MLQNYNYAENLICHLESYLCVYVSCCYLVSQMTVKFLVELKQGEEVENKVEEGVSQETNFPIFS